MQTRAVPQRIISVTFYVSLLQFAACRREAIKHSPLRVKRFKMVNLGARRNNCAILVDMPHFFSIKDTSSPGQHGADSNWRVVSEYSSGEISSDG